MWYKIYKQIVFFVAVSATANTYTPIMMAHTFSQREWFVVNLLIGQSSEMTDGL